MDLPKFSTMLKRRRARKAYKKYRQRVQRIKRRGYAKSKLLYDPSPKATIMSRPVVSDRIMTKLRYVEFRNLNAGTTSPNYAIYRANCVYDPYQTGIGHSCIGLDQWSAFFNHFTVLGSKIKVTFMNQAAAGTAGAQQVIGIALRDDTTTTSNNELFQERTNTVSGIIGPQDSAAGVKSLVKGFSCKQFFGAVNPIDEDDLAGSNATSPTEGAYYHVGVCSADPDGTDDPGEVRIKVEIEYAVLFHERKPLLQS